ncbi:MAG TPA: hypothetical protein VHD85_21230 [Terracidiphilus sp.]|nr:hypothetical protein [Terracidiphilus sp.]
MNLEMGDRRVSGSDVVSMMQAAEPRHGNDFCIQCCVLLGLAPTRSVFSQPEMRSIFVVIADVFVHQAFQMALIKNDDMIEQIAAAISDESFGNAVLPGALKTVSLGLDAKALDRFYDLFIEVGTAVEDQVGGRPKCRENEVNPPTNDGCLRSLAFAYLG